MSCVWITFTFPNIYWRKWFECMSALSADKINKTMAFLLAKQCNLSSMQFICHFWLKVILRAKPFCWHRIKDQDKCTSRVWYTLANILMCRMHTNCIHSDWINCLLILSFSSILPSWVNKFESIDVNSLNLCEQDPFWNSPNSRYSNGAWMSHAFC